MTLLRRAPREVYRVYSEDEFFECAAADEPPAATATGIERRRRDLGAAALLASIGAVGGLVAIASLTPAMRSGRGRGGLLAATGSFAASRLQGRRVWRQPAEHARPQPASASSRPAALAVTRASGPVGRARARIAPRSHDVVAHEPTAPILAASAESSQLAAVDRAAVSASTAAGPAASPPRGGASEFGFER